MDTFIQQMGRAGRDGKISQELILYKSHKNQIQNLDHEMKLIITDSDCRREIIAECYLTKRNLETVIDHICETKCKCNDIEAKITNGITRPKFIIFHYRLRENFYISYRKHHQ